jgi:hypothetical protein
MLTESQEKRIIYFQQLIDLTEKSFETKRLKYRLTLNSYADNIDTEISNIKYDEVDTSLEAIEQHLQSIRLASQQLNADKEYLTQIKNDYDEYLNKLGLELGNTSYDERTYNLLNNQILV